MPEIKVVVRTMDTIESKYRLNIYTRAGTIKQGLSVAIIHDMGKRNGDIIRSLSSTRWMTIDEICDLVWLFEKKMKYPTNRTRKSIEIAINELIERNMVIVKN